MFEKDLHGAMWSARDSSNAFIGRLEVALWYVHRPQSDNRVTSSRPMFGLFAVPGLIQLCSGIKGGDPYM